MDRVESMEVFTRVVELGSFTAAATECRLSPSMISKHINALEKRLGSTLLKRTTRTLKLTEIGSNYYENCKEILKQINEAEAGAEILRGKPRGQLRVSAPIWFGSITLTPLIADFLLEYPEVSIELTLADRFVDIIDEGFDVAIRIGELDDSTYVARKLTEFEVATCASPAYLERYGTPQHPDDLKQFQCLNFTNWKHDGGWKLLSKHLDSTLQANSRFDANHAQSLRTAAIKGLGLILSPRLLLDQDIKSGALVEVLQDFKPSPRPVNAIYPKERQTTPKLASFVDYLIAHLA
ncbi:MULTISPECIES: LysR family transcriptional regulator [unclassified Methylophilus]|uniref:LysR family transcriptional regulator n=1 Tax=unclassified Methylophilus TaxID=2630143 RepID=UPI0006FF9EF7|nr:MULTISPECIES: LysR family transcriptional regulator [unclassified Methylophilus]KQT41733.1 LysR family transcriptional regulator [Methylophilus sp. Leaf416]KQT55900.1 LysR family transcriptional regulator [Methylophilus sp. Leaf459]